jgi:4,5-dihydroxyphthalate decarboxylase
MAAGELHAAFTANAGIGRSGPPKAGWLSTKPPDTYAELFPDAERLETEWFRSTGIYPVHSLVVIKEALLEQHPWIAKSLFDALLQSKEAYLGRLQSGESVSDKDADYRKLAAVVGDPLPYGVDNNRPAIEALIRYSNQQGLLRKPVSVEELFLDPGKTDPPPSSKTPQGKP